MGLKLEIKKSCDAAGMEEDANNKPGHFMPEKRFDGEGGILRVQTPASVAGIEGRYDVDRNPPVYPLHEFPRRPV